MTHPAAFARQMAGQAVECRLCPHRCRLAPGESGRCRVRANQAGQLLALSYARPAAILLETIEKKTLFHFRPGSRALSIGTPGCNLRCRGCINWRLSQSGPLAAGAEVPPTEVVARAGAQAADGIAFTFSEPTVFFEYARDIAHLARHAGLYVVAKSNGFILPTALREMATWLDAINIDLKGWRGPRHGQLTGGRVGPVLDSLKLARRLGLWLEVSTLLVPGFNDDSATLGAIAAFIAAELGPQTPWHLLRFFPEYQQADLTVTSQTWLGRALEIGQKAGLAYIYNSTADQGRWLHTRCPHCASLLVERRGHECVAQHLQGGRCPQCGLFIPGRWSAPGGEYGG